MASLTSHILDLNNGRPATGMVVRLYRDRHLLWEMISNGDGRLPETAIASGRYRLEFAAADYYRHLGVALAEPAFLDVVAIEFSVADAGHYHVPLLLSPYGYSTYRGS